MVKSLLMVLFATSLALSPTAASGQPQDPREAQARKDCLTGRVESGAALLAELFAETANANFIFNQARCYEQNGRYEDAINRFREYVRLVKDITPADKADVEQHLADCRLQLEQKLAKVAAVTDPAAPVPEAPIPAPPVAPSTSVAGSPVSPPDAPVAAPSASGHGALPAPVPIPPGAVAARAVPQDTGAKREGRGLRIAGVACGAVGAASIATAIYFYTRARSMSDKVSNHPIVDSSDYQAGKDAETLQWVFYGIGAAAVATGATLYGLGLSAAAPSNVSLAPIVGPGLAAISARGAF